MNRSEDKRVAVYTRISKDRYEDQSGVTRQKADCEEFVAKLKADGQLRDDAEIQHYCDNDISAYQTKKPRPAFVQMLVDAEAGRLEAIVAYHSDRLYRTLKDMLNVATVLTKSDGLLVHTVRSGMVDFSTPAGRLTATMLASIGQYEVELKADRQRAASEALANSGLPMRGGHRPFGYTHDDNPDPRMRRYVEVVEDEAELIREAVRRIIDGHSLRTIVRDWNKRGLPTSKGNKWTGSSLRWILTNPRYAGMRVHRGKPFAKATWPAIVPRGDFELVGKILSDPARKSTATRTPRHLLSVLAVCNECGAKLVAAHTPGSGSRAKHWVYRHYVTDSCHGTIARHVLEHTVNAFVALRLMSPDRDLLELNREERSAMRALQSRLSELDEQERLLEGSKISTASLLRQLEALNAERSRLLDDVATTRQRMALVALMSERFVIRSGTGCRVDMDQALAQRHEVQSAFEDMDITTRRDIIQALCEVRVTRAEPGVRYFNGRSAARVLIYPRNPATGELADDPIVGSELVATSF